MQSETQKETTRDVVNEAAGNREGFIGRELDDHKTSKLNRESIVVKTADLRASDNAHHAYTIEVIKRAQTSDEKDTITHSVVIQFQNGGLREVGPNGITDQALIAIVLDRMCSFNTGPYGCRENSLAITHFEEGLMWMEKRANDRARRGVEGQRLQ